RCGGGRAGALDRSRSRGRKESRGGSGRREEGRDAGLTHSPPKRAAARGAAPARSLAAFIVSQAKRREMRGMLLAFLRAAAFAPLLLFAACNAAREPVPVAEAGEPAIYRSLASGDARVDAA